MDHGYLPQDQGASSGKHTGSFTDRTITIRRPEPELRSPASGTGTAVKPREWCSGCGIWPPRPRPGFGQQRMVPSGTVGPLHGAGRSVARTACWDASGENIQASTTADARRKPASPGSSSPVLAVIAPCVNTCSWSPQTTLTRKRKAGGNERPSLPCESDETENCRNQLFN